MAPLADDLRGSTVLQSNVPTSCRTKIIDDDDDERSVTLQPCIVRSLFVMRLVFSDFGSFCHESDVSPQ